MHDRTGLLLLRIWLDGDPDGDGLRARITQTVDLSARAQVVTVAATTDDVCAAVREWLEAYLAG